MSKKEMTLETFNDMLVNLGSIDEKDLLEHELQYAYALKIQAMEDMVEAINDQKSIKEIQEKLEVVNNIDSNLDLMAEQLNAMGVDDES